MQYQLCVIYLDQLSTKNPENGHPLGRSVLATELLGVSAVLQEFLLSPVILKQRSAYRPAWYAPGALYRAKWPPQTFLPDSPS